MKNYQAEAISPVKYRLAEAPRYDGRTGRLSWVDIPEGRLHWRFEDGREGCADFGWKLGAAVPLQRSDGFLLAGAQGLYLYENGETTLLRDLSGELAPWQRCNDAGPDPAGRFFFGSAVDDMEHEMRGNLYCYDRGDLRCMEEGTKIANGMVWNRAGDRFFLVDSLEFGVFAYDYDKASGKISGKTMLCKIEGLPDGLCIDAEDDLWIAVWGGRIEQRSTKDGSLLAQIAVPAERPTSCCFIGEKLDTLFITSSGDGLSGAQDGCLFTAQVEARGLPTGLAVVD